MVVPSNRGSTGRLAGKDEIELRVLLPATPLILIAKPNSPAPLAALESLISPLYNIRRLDKLIDR